MRDDAPKKWTLLSILGSALLLWGILKASVIGYYPDEFLAQILVPMALGVALLGIDRLRTQREN